MRFAHLVFALTLLSGTASANPIVVSHPYCIVSERLEVTITEDGAIFDGHFRFRSEAIKGTLGETADVGLEVPLWIPSDAKRATGETAEFLSLYRRDPALTVYRKPLELATALKLTVGTHTIDDCSIVIHDLGSRADRQRIPAEWQKSGYFCVVFHFDFPSNWLTNAPEVHLSYRQPLNHTRNEHEFFYVPIFYHLPQGRGTNDIDLYSMRITNKCRSSLSFGGMDVGTDYTAILPLAHHAPITARSKRG